ncbi:CAAX prenyl protease [Coemansia thaxteri]|uniref:intramembrane prenyl-peptidase Rce1 n=1 Tax=Coemansia thaxteri TaxID=2663907 RepID=A0A9W8BHY3_9FUNG|nr:CAAX prenyl protease [Coemansia thaxteri]KAJ2487657.1 CAAX prenyl protease [Coemansia sp. RSA 2320]
MRVEFLVVAVLLAVLYVVFIYAAEALLPCDASQPQQQQQPQTTRSRRDEPAVIRQRMRGACVATAVSLGLAACVLWLRANEQQIGKEMGLAPRAAPASALVGVVLTCVGFLGPLAVDRLEGAFQWDSVRAAWSAWGMTEWRNLVVGPVTEELVFRGSVVPLWLKAGVSPAGVIAFSPLVFAAAHVHHAVAALVAVPRPPVNAVLARMVLQISYTWVFGCFAAALFIRTHSVAGSIAAHIVCNHQGLPDLRRISAGFPQYKYPLWIAHVVGLVGLAVLFEPMTRPGVFISE